MRNVVLNATLQAKLDAFYKAILSEITEVCEASSLSKEETSLIKRYLKCFLSFKKRGNIKDIPVIQKIVKNRTFLYNLSDYYILYPFLEDLILDMCEVERLYSDLCVAMPWENWRTVQNFLSSRSSYSCFSILYAYVMAMKPDSEDIRKYDIQKAGSPYRENPVEDFYSQFKNRVGFTKAHVTEQEFYTFCKCVLHYFPEEEPSLREISLSCGNEDRNINSAEIWVSRFLNEDSKEGAKISEPISTPKKRKSRPKVGIVYDITLSQRTSNEISIEKNLGENFAPYQVAIEQINANYPGVFPISDAGILSALCCLFYLSDGQTDIEPIDEDEDGITYEASIYQLYSTVKGAEYKPSIEDVSRFITGLEFLSYPRRIPRKVRNAKTGKEETIINSLAFLTILNKIILPQVEDADEKKKIIKEQELGKQKVRFRIHKAFYCGFTDETKGENDEMLYLPIESKGKERRYFQRVSFEKSASMEWMRFLCNLSSCVQMQEDNLLERVFDYQGAIAKARSWDIKKCPCDKVEIRHGKPYQFQTWEEYKKRMISKKEKTKDKKTLLSYFERAQKEGEIISYKLKNGVYSWRYKEGAE